jgi:Domain of Unknown Function (DUF1259)
MKNAFKICFIALISIGMMVVPTINISTQQDAIAQSQLATNQKNQMNQGNQTNTLDCKALSSQTSKSAVPINNPNKDVCDTVILRTNPLIIGQNGTILNKFLVINSIIEIMPAPTNLSSPAEGNTNNNSSSPMVVVMGEFALLQNELKPALMSLSKANLNVTAVHNHPILEKPPMIFVHWNTMGTLDKVMGQVKNVVSEYEKIQLQSGQGQNQGGNSTGNPLEQIGKTLGGALGLDK